MSKREMDLTDATLRERAIEVLRACSLTPRNDSRPSVTDRVEVCVSDLLDAVVAALELVRDAARAEQRERPALDFVKALELATTRYRKSPIWRHLEGTPWENDAPAIAAELMCSVACPPLVDAAAEACGECAHRKDQHDGPGERCLMIGCGCKWYKP